MKTTIATLWRTDARLTAVGFAMVALLAATGVALLVDPREVLGAPLWMKPAKFAASIAIYTLTLAWVFTYLPEWVRTRRIVSWVTAVTLVLEIVIIDVQAWRGTTSHFNVGTLVDGVLFTIMGLAIVVQTLTACAVAVALWRQRFSDRAIGWALRFGMTMTIVGAMTGGLMTRPTREQLDNARAGHRMTVAGAHTVGAPDGGPGLPGTGWSREHGDIRVAHFVGLHALQMLSLRRARVRRGAAGTDARRVRIVWAISASYASLFALLLWQALRGQSVTAPDAATLTALAAWAVLTALALAIAARAAKRRAPAPSCIEELIMSPNQIFSIANFVALCGWLLLILLPGRKWVNHLVAGVALPAAFAALYIVIVAVHFFGSAGGFSSLPHVALLFSNPWMLLAGWIHYLAFDMLVGSWEARDARERGIPHLLRGAVPDSDVPLWSRRLAAVSRRAIARDRESRGTRNGNRHTKIGCRPRRHLRNTCFWRGFRRRGHGCPGTPFAPGGAWFCSSPSRFFSARHCCSSSSR